MKDNLYIVVGAGSSGMAVCKLLHKLGHQVRLVDRKAENINAEFHNFAKKSNIEIVCGEHNAEQFTGANSIILSPGVPSLVVKKFLPSTAELLSETEFAWRHLQGEKLLGVTGTSGKTTTVSLCEAMLKEQGLEVFLGGNIGTPLSQYVLERLENRPKADVIVLELSSFQLQTCSSLHLNVAMILNISENHLDYHADMNEYVQAKTQIFANQNSCDYAMIDKTLEQVLDMDKIKAKLKYISLVPGFAKTNLFGQHNKLNISCAYLACQPFGLSLKQAEAAVEKFMPLEHRLENVGTLNGVTYVNDSKCTTIAALQMALQAFDCPIHLLVGGKFKGGDLSLLNGLISERVKSLGLFGGSREVFINAWQDLTKLSYAETLEQALVGLSAHAKPGEIVLLAPATASYDQYVNYMARGEDFKRIVKEVLA